MAGEIELSFADADADADAEVVDAIVVHDARAQAVARSQYVVAAQAAVVATASFVAGAATLAVVSRRRGRVPLKPALPRPKPAPVFEVVASQRFLVDVHQLRRR